MLLSTTKRTPYPLSIPPLLTKKKKVRRSVSQERGEEETSFKTDFCGNWFPLLSRFDLCLDRSRTDSIGRAVYRPLLSSHPKDKRLNTTHITVEFAVSEIENLCCPHFPIKKFDAFLVPLSNEKTLFIPTAPILPRGEKWSGMRGSKKKMGYRKCVFLSV